MMHFKQGVSGVWMNVICPINPQKYNIVYGFLGGSIKSKLYTHRKDGFTLTGKDKGFPQSA